MKHDFEKVIAALEKNNMQGIYAADCKEACKIAEDMLFDGCFITSGGSVSLKESGVWDVITGKKYNFADRTKPGITVKDQTEIFKSVIDGDFYFCSANAVTENGELVNVDGFSNRISAICFGPKKVIVIAGKNKIVKDVSEGLLRVKKTAAPKNCVRLERKTPCAKTGHCISLDRSDNPDMCDGCASPDRICRNYLISGPQMIKDRITVILVDENLGY